MISKKQKTSQNLFAATVVKTDYSMKAATIIGVGVHVLLIFGISFTTGKSPTALAKDVATALIQNTEKNEDAMFIADGAQQGSGDNEEVIRQSTSQMSPLTAMEVQETQDVFNQQKQNRQKRYQQSYLVTTLSYREIEKDSDNDDEKADDQFKEQDQRIRKDIATLEAQLSRNDEALSTNTKIKTVNSNSTTYEKVSVYLDNFRKHVERTANHYYPAKALAQNITGDVRLMIIINYDGTVKAIRLQESSGSKILDEAAKQSVRQSAPYGKFTKDMKEVEELRIIRTWRYTGESVSNF